MAASPAAAMSRAIDALIGRPIAFIRFSMKEADVACTGSISEWISGGEPRPSGWWQDSQSRRYRSDPDRTKRSLRSSLPASWFHRGSYFTDGGGVFCPMRPMLVRSKSMPRWVNQLPPETGVTRATMLRPTAGGCAS
jgi:hypothetical protein